MTVNNGILEQVRKVVLETNPSLGPDDVVPESTFGTLGLDSIKLVELGVRIEELFGEDVTLDDWVDQEKNRAQDGFTVASLVTFIEQATCAKEAS